MRHASLFSGIGGFDLATSWMGWENVFQVEIDEFCQKVLQKNFPNVKRYGDIKQFDGAKYRGAIDVLSGGFPCQPYSSAGKRKGKDDERHLWPEMLRVIREISPRWVVGENVRGLTNWNGGLVFDEVQADLEAAGYEVTPFLLPAAGVNAPHERYRIWFIAYSASFRRDRIIFTRQGLQRAECARRETGASNNKKGIITNTTSQCQREQADKINAFPIIGETWPELSSTGRGKTAADTNGVNGCQGWKPSSEQKNRAFIIGDSTRGPGDWKHFPTQSPLCGGNDGVPNRMDRIKGLGNAVVPQVVYQILKAIEQYEHINSSTDKEVQQ